MELPFSPYAGDAPYIFVCYAHSDADIVYPDIRYLHDQGVNVWYDEGVSPGSEWSDSLARHIENCACFLYFISPDSVESEHCRRELNFAQEESRPVLCVEISPTHMPPGLRLSLNNRQIVRRQDYSEGAYRQKLLAAITNDSDQRLQAETPTKSEDRVATRRRDRSRSIGTATFDQLLITRIQQVAPPRRSFINSLIVTMIFMFIGGTVGINLARYGGGQTYLVQPDEFVDTDGIARALYERATPATQSLWKGLNGPTRESISTAIDEGRLEEALPRIEFELRIEFNRLIASEVFLLGPDENPQWNDGIQALYRQHRTADETARISRKALDSIFEDELQRWVEPPRLADDWDRIIIYAQFDPTLLSILILLVVIGLPVLAYLFSLGVLDVSFRDARNIDGILEYFVTNMGFKPPRQEGDVLVFNATLITVLIYNVLSLKVKIDGNRILITAPLPLIRRMKKRFRRLAD